MSHRFIPLRRADLLGDDQQTRPPALLLRSDFAAPPRSLITRRKLPWHAGILHPVVPLEDLDGQSPWSQLFILVEQLVDLVEQELAAAWVGDDLTSFGELMREGVLDTTTYRRDEKHSHFCSTKYLTEVSSCWISVSMAHLHCCRHRLTDQLGARSHGGVPS